MYRVFVVDDEPSVIEGLKIMIPWNELGFELCGDADNAQQALARIEELRPHLLISDIKMPQKSGLALIKDARGLDFDMEVIILSGYSDFQYAREAMRIQVFDYLLKPLDRDELICVLTKIKKKLDDTFLVKYGFTLEDIEEFKADRSTKKDIGEQPDAAGRTGTVLKKYLDNDFDEELIRSIKLMDYNEAKKLVDGLFDFIRSNDLAPAEMRLIVNSCIYSILHAAYERNIRLKSVWQTEKSEDWSWEEAYRNIDAILLEIIGTMLEDRRKVSHAYLYDVKEYIESHYNEDLSVANLAEIFYLEAGYLGEAFIKQFGCSINEYQHRLRIKKAIELIRTTDMKLSEISNAVGYNNYNNFFVRFEKLTNKKPTDFDNRGNVHTR